MSTDLEERISRLAARWDDAAPTITMDEILREHRPQPIAVSTELFDDDPVSLLPDVPRRRGKFVVVGLVAAIVLFTGLIVIRSRRLDAPPPPALDTTVTTSQVAPTSTATPLTVAPATTTTTVLATTTTATATTPAPPALTLADVQAQAALALSRFDTFRATVTTTAAQSSETTPAQTRVATVTMGGDGRMWVANQPTGWSSFDPTTGTARTEYQLDDGITHYQQIEGWANNATAVGITFGYDPVAAVAQINDTPDTQVVELDEAGRPEWKITSNGESFVVDQQTGLTVGHTPTTSGGATTTTTTELTDLEVNVDFPAEFPGVFPAGANIERSGDPAGFQPMTLDQALAQFGPNVYTIDGLPPASRIYTERIDGGTWAWVSLKIDIPTGFAKSQIWVAETVPTDPTKPDPGSIIVDGLMCMSPDGINCDEAGATEIVASGALAGRKILRGPQTVTVFSGPVHVIVTAPSVDQALDIVNSLVHYGA